VRRRLAALFWLVPHYIQLAWWGLATPRLRERAELVVVQAVVLRGGDVLLAVRRELRGWELPGGEPRAGESFDAALRREVREETGFEVEIEREIGRYRRTGFRRHLARVFRCRVIGGALRESPEMPRVAWFSAAAPPSTLFPWYRQPLADALRECAPVAERREHQGLRAILAGFWIDLRMRISGDQAT
jgi:ADP-ribose pyrophosphatase YjhB (NUDIX family)